MVFSEFVIKMYFLPRAKNGIFRVQSALELIRKSSI